MNTFVERDPPESVPEVGKVSVNGTKLSGDSDADGRFSDLSGKVCYTQSQSTRPARSRLGQNETLLSDFGVCADGVKTGEGARVCVGNAVGNATQELT